MRGYPLHLLLLWALPSAVVVSAIQHHQRHAAINNAAALFGRDTLTTATPVATGTATGTVTATINWTQVSRALNGWLSGETISQIATVPTETLAISIPSSLRNEILTAVPASVLVQLMNPVERSSIASEFQEGATPSWYQALPTDLKSFFSSMAAGIATGSEVFTVTPTMTATGADPAATGGSDINGAAQSSSSSAAAARPTGVLADRGIVAGAVGMAGVMVAMLAL